LNSCCTDQLTRHKQPGLKPATKTDPKNRAALPPWLFAAAYTQRPQKYFALSA
jgi:hypothetical protein